MANAERVTWAGRLLAGWVAGVCQRPRLVLAVCLLSAAIAVAYAACRLEYRTQRSDLMDPRHDTQRRWREYLAEFGDEDDMVVVAEGRDRARMKSAVDAVADAVRQQPALFDRLFYRVDLGNVRDRALLYLPPGQLREIQANLGRMSPLLAFGELAWSSLTVQPLLDRGTASARPLATGKPLDPDGTLFLSQLTSVVRSADATLADPANYRNPWGSLVREPADGHDRLSEPQYFFSGDGSLAFLLVRPVKEAGSFAPARAGVAALRTVVADVGRRYPDVRLGLTGLPVLETDEMVASQNDSALAGWLALAGVALLYLIAYRSWRYPVLTVSALLVGTGWALGWLTLTVGHLNILSSTFAVMLIGLGDFGVLWVTRYDQERRSGACHDEANRRTALHAGPSIVVAAVSMAVAFFATTLADFRAVAELGWIAGSGILLCALACFTLLPASMQLLRGWEAGRYAPHHGRPCGEPIPRTAGYAPQSTVRTVKAWVVLALGVPIAAMLAGWGCRLGFDYNMLHMQAEGLDSVKWELRLIEKTAGASWSALSLADTPEEALALKEKYAALPEVSQVVEVASLVPPDQAEKLPLIRDVRRRLAWLPARHSPIEHGTPDLADLRRACAALLAALPADAAGTAGELRTGLAGLLARIDGLPRSVATQRLQHFEDRMTADLLEDLHRLRAVANPAPITLADLPPELRERYIGTTGKWLVRAFARDCLWEHAPLRRFVEVVRAVDPRATGKPFGTLEGLETMKAGFEWAALYALIAIVVVLLVDFRSVGFTLLALVPLGVGVAATLGVLALLGMSLNPANMLALPLIVGVGVDNGVHVLHDFRARQRGRAYSLGGATARGILVAALTTVLGFGALMISGHRGLVSLGFVLALGVSCCLAAALLLLPAALRLLTLPRRPRLRLVNADDPPIRVRRAA